MKWSGTQCRSGIHELEPNLLIQIRCLLDLPAEPRTKPGPSAIHHTNAVCLAKAELGHLSSLYDLC